MDVWSGLMGNLLDFDRLVSLCLSHQSRDDSTLEAKLTWALLRCGQYRKYLSRRSIGPCCRLAYVVGSLHLGVARCNGLTAENGCGRSFSSFVVTSSVVVETYYRIA